LELTAAGTVQEFSDIYQHHLIPFSACISIGELSTILSTIINEKNGLAKF
jgi:hypothetical protein